MNLKQLLKTSISENLTDKSAIIGNVLASEAEAPRTHRKFFKPLIAAALVTVLIMSITLIAVATSKSAKITLNITNDSIFTSIRKDDTLTVTASISNFSQYTKMYGFTMDIEYDNTKFDYVGIDDSLVSENFKILANGDNPGVVTVLFYANDASGSLSSIDVDSPLFSLDFLVTGNANGTYDFAPEDWMFADKKTEGTGFEEVILDTTTSMTKSVTTKVIKTGDIDANNIVDPVDLVLLKKHLVQPDYLSGGALLAAKTGANPISAQDLVWIKRELLGLNS